MLEFRNFEEYFSNDLIITNKRFAISFWIFNLKFLRNLQSVGKSREKKNHG